MKKHFFLAIALPVAFALTSCGGSSKDNKKDNNENQQPETEVVEAEPEPEVKEPAFPWDFPEGIKNEGLAEGQQVLSIHSFYPNALKEKKDPANEGYIFYNATLSEIGDTKSKVKSFGDAIEMPNSLIIPLPEGQTAKKGDIILTWWQTGSGMQRAIVTDASDPTAPKVDYLDLNYKDDGKGFANEHANEQIKPNTFVVLKDGEWQPGAQIVVTGDDSYEVGTLVSSTDDKVLLKCFAGKIQVFDKADCIVLPLRQNLKPGDEVRAIFTSYLKDGYKVKKVDEKIGRVWVEGGFGDAIVNILEVLKK
jgi:hypothetical protein